ncbi:MAG TPA: hypothetical protein VE912_22415 [Bacteroidales bacterium]|nr:hypothetical protein [Bacteroidales bacterium]
MKKNELFEILNSKSSNELVDELILLSENFSVVRDYFDLKHKNKTKLSILKKYKQKISNAIYPDWEFNEGLNIDFVEEIIEEFSRVTPNIDYQIELELYALETGNKCANDMGGDFGEEYYIYFEELFEKTLIKLNKRKISTQILEKINSILKIAFEGYGHKDSLEDLWAEHEENPKEY